MCSESTMSGSNGVTTGYIATNDTPDVQHLCSDKGKRKAFSFFPKISPDSGVKGGSIDTS